MFVTFLFLCSDDDSEPILGQWFEETISPSKEKVAPPPPPPPPPLESSPRVKSPSKQAPGEKGNILASRKDPELVSGILRLRGRRNGKRCEKHIIRTRRFCRMGNCNI